MREGEKNPGEGSEKEPETVYVQAWEPLYGVTAYLLYNGSATYICSKVNRIGEPKGNRVLTGRKLQGIDPKPGDLAMGRLKVGNTNWRTEPTNVEKLADDLWRG